MKAKIKVISNGYLVTTNEGTKQEETKYYQSADIVKDILFEKNLEDFKERLTAMKQYNAIEKEIMVEIPATYISKVS